MAPRGGDRAAPDPDSRYKDAISPRVLIVSVSLLHRGRDPRTIRAERLIDGLGARGFELDAISLWLGPGPPPAATGTRRTIAVEAPVDWQGAGAGAAINEEGLGEWISASARSAARLPAAERPDLVYAIGVPVSALVAGAEIAAALALPLVVDLGDPWTAGGREQAALRARVLGAAAAAITTTPEMAERLRPALAPGTPLLLAPAGGELLRRRPRPAGEPPLVVHLGAINRGRVDPGPAFATLAAAHREGRIEFRSHSTGWHPDLEQLPHPHLPLIPHREALALLAQSSAALVLGNDNHEQLPSKVFELACTETWALCVSELEADAGVELLRRSGHAIVAERNDEAAIDAALGRILRRESLEERPLPVERHSWRHRLDRIAELLRPLAA